MKSVVGSSRKCAACIHVYLSGEMRVGDIAAPMGVCTPIMHFHIVFHGEVDGTKEAYGPWRDMESQSGYPSSVTI